MRSERSKTILRCAVYTRVSTEHGLEQEFNSLDNQREASEAYIKSQAHEGWRLMRDRYDDGGFSGGSMERPALKKLLDATDGNLSVHARKLEEAGYVTCTKTFQGRIPKSDYRLAAAGRRALDRYLDHMEALIQAMREK